MTTRVPVATPQVRQVLPARHLGGGLQPTSLAPAERVSRPLHPDGISTVHALNRPGEPATGGMPGAVSRSRLSGERVALAEPIHAGTAFAGHSVQTAVPTVSSVRRLPVDRVVGTPHASPAVHPALPVTALSGSLQAPMMVDSSLSHELPFTEHQRSPAEFRSVPVPTQHVSQASVPGLGRLSQQAFSELPMAPEAVLLSKLADAEAQFVAFGGALSPTAAKEPAEQVAVEAAMQEQRHIRAQLTSEMVVASQLREQLLEAEQEAQHHRLMAVISQTSGQDHAQELERLQSRNAALEPQLRDAINLCKRYETKLQSETSVATRMQQQACLMEEKAEAEAGAHARASAEALAARAAAAEAEQHVQAVSVQTASREQAAVSDAARIAGLEQHLAFAEELAEAESIARRRADERVQAATSSAMAAEANAKKQGELALEAEAAVREVRTEAQAQLRLATTAGPSTNDGLVQELRQRLAAAEMQADAEAKAGARAQAEALLAKASLADLESQMQDLRQLASARPSAPGPLAGAPPLKPPLGPRADMVEEHAPVKRQVSKNTMLRGIFAPPLRGPAADADNGLSSSTDRAQEFFQAAEVGDTVAMKSLMEGPPAALETALQARDKEGRSLLHAALSNPDGDEVARMMLEEIRRLGSKKRFLHHLHGEMLEMELSRCIDSCDRDGRTPLMALCSRRPGKSSGREMADLAVELLEAQADPEMRDKDGATSFLKSAEAGNTSMMAMFLSVTRGDILMDADDNYRSALHYAAREGHQAASALLLKANIDVNLVDCDGHTAASLAEACGQSELAALLKEAGEEDMLGKKAGDSDDDDDDAEELDEGEEEEKDAPHSL